MAFDLSTAGLLCIAWTATLTRCGRTFSDFVIFLREGIEFANGLAESAPKERVAMRCSSRVRVSCAIVLCAGLAFLASVSSVEAARRLNVILFVTDDQSPDAGCYGNPIIQTPNMDALAKDGIRFTNAFCTTASCSASRSVILSGVYNHANAQYGHQHSYHHFRTYDHMKTLSARLTEAGYHTARIGKYHVGPEEVYPFETVIQGASSRSPVQMADLCETLIRDEEERPFFLYFCTSDPHRSGGSVAGAEHHPNPFGNKPKGYPGVKEVKYDPKQVLVHSFLPDTPVCRAELAQYYQSVSRIDQGLGRLIEHLKKHGQYEQTLIIFTSDHGIAFPGGKTTLYEGGMRVPFLVRDPQQSRRGDCNAMINLADITPTILDYADAAPKKKGEVQGRSFRKAMEQADAKGWDEVYASHTFHEITMYYPMRVVRTRNHKLIWNIAHGLPYPFASDLWAAPTWQDVYIHRPKFELFDLKSDPYEATNLADDPRYADLLGQLQEKLKRFQKQTKDPWIRKWTYE